MSLSPSWLLNGHPLTIFFSRIWNEIRHMTPSAHLCVIHSMSPLCANDWSHCKQKTSYLKTSDLHLLIMPSTQTETAGVFSQRFIATPFNTFAFVFVGLSVKGMKKKKHSFCHFAHWVDTKTSMHLYVSVSVQECEGTFLLLRAWFDNRLIDPVIFQATFDGSIYSNMRTCCIFFLKETEHPWVVDYWSDRKKAISKHDLKLLQIVMVVFWNVFWCLTDRLWK